MKYLRQYYAASGFFGLDENQRWRGTVGTLLEVLDFAVPETFRNHDGWPLKPNSLSHRLRELKDALDQYGVRINFKPKLPGFRKYKRFIEIRYS